MIRQLLYEPETDASQTFNIDQALNANSEKIDDAHKNICEDLKNKSPSNHTHDDRYYTEAEIDEKLGQKAPASHASDTSIHVTAEEKAEWSGKAAGTHASQHASTGDDPITPKDIDAIPATEKGVAGGVASLGTDGKVPGNQLPDMNFASKTHAAQHESGGTDPIDLSKLAGILGVEHGGTGFNSLDALAAALGSVKIATGSYTGTGTYGSANPCSLTFDFTPRILVVQHYAGTGSRVDHLLIAVYGTENAVTLSYEADSNSSVAMTWGNPVSWFSNGQYEQMNAPGAIYNYIAIG